MPPGCHVTSIELQQYKQFIILAILEMVNVIFATQWDRRHTGGQRLLKIHKSDHHSFSPAHRLAPNNGGSCLCQRSVELHPSQVSGLLSELVPYSVK